MDFLLNHAYSFYVGASAFLIFFFLIAKFGVKPILQAVDARDAKIARELKESEDAYAKAKELREELDTQLRSAESRIAEMIAEARRDAEALKGGQVEEGRKEIDAIRQRSLREIDAARQSALVQLRGQIADLAALVAEKAIHERLDMGKHAELIVSATSRFDDRKMGT